MFFFRGATAARPTRRRWTRFSLRTMFVVTTAICCWLGWELIVFRERRELRRTLQEQAEYQFFTADQFANAPAPQTPEPAPSWLRRLLGDEPIQTIWCPPNVAETALEVAWLRRVFPEAELRQAQ